MKLNKIALAATSGLVAVSVLAGSLAHASTDSDAKSAQELQAFLAANPEAAAALEAVETKTGGKVVDAEFDDETQGKGIVEFEVIMTDGSEQEFLYTLADGSMTFVADEDSDDDDDDDGDHGDDENEADDD